MMPNTKQRSVRGVLEFRLFFISDPCNIENRVSIEFHEALDGGIRDSDPRCFGIVLAEVIEGGAQKRDKEKHPCLEKSSMPCLLILKKRNMNSLNEMFFTLQSDVVNTLLLLLTISH
jgi:hypothetical protein